MYDDEVSDFSQEFAFYFDTIMRPFKDKIREAVAKVEDLPIDLVCPSHGPFCEKTPEGPSKLTAAGRPSGRLRPAGLLLTLSPHGNTREMAA